MMTRQERERETETAYLAQAYEIDDNTQTMTGTLYEMDKMLNDTKKIIETFILETYFL